MKSKTQKRKNPLLIGLTAGSVVFILVMIVGFLLTSGQQKKPALTQRQAAAIEQQTDTDFQIKALRLSALDQIDLGHNETAVKILTQAVKIAPDESENYYYRAVAYSNLGEYEKALADFQAAAEKNPHWALPLAGRGSVNVAQGNLDAAIEDFGEAIYLEPDQGDLYSNRGQIYHQLGKLTQARDDYNMAVELNPDSIAARFNRAVLLYALGKNEEAVFDLTYAIKIDPNHAPLYFNRGIILADMGRTEDARADLEHFISISNNSEWIKLAEESLAELK
ncbi:MAG TPA: tetratricopeptide repeat protein [Chloroflexi bacterium]|nr:MAG: hypothetical protein B6243_14030 [Anaerolineaceae bacterium 4572_5.2]HEY84118.1 tetratricopeptide repeat protein [Chloroflexota bacterium]